MHVSCSTGSTRHLPVSLHPLQRRIVRLESCPIHSGKTVICISALNLGQLVRLGAKLQLPPRALPCVMSCLKFRKLPMDSGSAEHTTDVRSRTGNPRHTYH
jgi:hypothetical protein